MSTLPISRRDFLKLSASALVGLFLPELFISPKSALAETISFQGQGRVVTDSLKIFDSPTVAGKVVGNYWRDIVFPLSSATLDEDLESRNRVWYQVGNEGFVHSGSVQLVQTVLNTPPTALPPEHFLAEVTVPYTDAYKTADKAGRLTFRLYYETVHWINGLEIDKDGAVWYRLNDDKRKNEYFAQAEHLRVIPIEELSPLSPDLPAQEKLIEVHLNQQLVIAYESKKPVFAARVSTGGRFSTGNYSTPVGNYKTYHKRHTRHMAAGNLATGFDLPGVPWVSYITEEGISFHGTYWHNDYGQPRSHGCINMTPQAARWVYRWTTPTVPLEKHYVYKRNTGTNIVIRK